MSRLVAIGTSLAFMGAFVAECENVSRQNLYVWMDVGAGLCTLGPATFTTAEGAALTVNVPAPSYRWGESTFNVQYKNHQNVKVRRGEWWYARHEDGSVVCYVADYKRA